MNQHCPFCDGFRVGDRLPGTIKICVKHDLTPEQKLNFRRRVRPWLLKTVDDEQFTEFPA